MKVLVVGYGNTLRGDDGVGYRIAEQIEAMDLPGIDAIACHQLIPELAPAIAACDRVIFVDAALPNAQKTIAVQSLQSQAATLDTHHSNPAGLLNLAAHLYDGSPEAYHVLIPTAEMGFTEVLSAIAQQGITAALEEIQQLIASA